MAGIWDTLKQGASQAWSGTPERFEPISTLNPQQQSMQSSILSSLAPQLQQQQSFDFNPIEQVARRDFSEKTIPSIMSRFSYGGRHGELPYALGSAGSGLEQNLAAMKSNIGLQQQDMNNRRLMSLLGYGMAPSQDLAHYQGQPGISGAIGQAAGMMPLMWMLNSGAFGSAGQPFGGQQQQGGWLMKLLNMLGRGAAGGAAGSMLGPIGTGVGAGLGALSSFF